MSTRQEQNLSTKLGEVDFRRKLATQQGEDGSIIFPEVHGHEELLELMRGRIEATSQSMHALLGQGVRISPFLELGAERCQRALLLENEFEGHGIAVDISFDMLRFAEVVAHHFGYERMPLRICCDAYNLPIGDDVLPFAFAYQTLHHFPDPVPICQEIARVLGDRGTLYFDEEPVQGAIRRFTPVYHRRGYRLSRGEQLLDRLHLLSLVSKPDELEREHGILEEEFDLRAWKRALSPFQNVEITVNKKLEIQLDGFGFGISRAMAEMVGGNIEAVCHIKKQKKVPEVSGDLIAVLRCPGCQTVGALHESEERQGLRCAECGAFHPKVAGVNFLFESSLGQRLYPEVYSSKADRD